jgi:zinc protease
MNFENINEYHLDRSKPPKPGNPKDVRFPEFFETKTASGITVLVIQDNMLPVVNVRFVFKAGSYHDDIPGVSAFTVDMLSKGTSKMSATEIASKIDFYGATLSYGSDYDANFVSIYTLKKYFDDVYNITADIINDAVFSNEEIERLRTQKINSILSFKDEGEYLASRAFKKFVYGKNTYANPIEGDENTLKEINRVLLLKFNEKYFTPENLIVAFVGDIEPNEALKYVKRLEEGNKKSKNGSENNNDTKLQIANSNPKVLLINKRDAVQSSLKVGHISKSRSDVNFFSLSIMNNILGGSFTSRINSNLRERNGYTYGARSFFELKKYSGDFSVETDVKTDITANAVKEIIFEINRMRNEYISDDELSIMKNYITGNFPLQLETPGAIASRVIALKLFDLEDDYYQKYISNVNAVTKEDVKKAAEEYLRPDNLVLSIAGNVKELEKQMKQFGDIEVVSI